MRTRVSLALPAVVLLVVAALVLGSVGSATAEAITSKTVKKIATKVVRKQAPSLTVAGAANATNAQNAQALAGQPAPAYRTAAYRYELSTANGVIRSFTFPGLPRGTYDVAYSVYTTTSGSPLGMYCGVRPSGAAGTVEAFSYGSVAFNNHQTFSGSATVTTTATTDLTCEAAVSGSFSVPGGAIPSAVTFTRVDDLAEG